MKQNEHMVAQADQAGQPYSRALLYIVRGQAVWSTEVLIECDGAHRDTTEVRDEEHEATTGQMQETYFRLILIRAGQRAFTRWLLRKNQS